MRRKMEKLTKLQQSILKRLKNGEHINCSEGKNYKAWFVLPNGQKEFVRRDSMSKVVGLYLGNLSIGKTIFWKS